MDTPDKATEFSPSSFLNKFEDSPVFNYINTLSPIKPFSLGHNTPFHPFDFSSPQNLLTPPTNPKESKIPRASRVTDVPQSNYSQDEIEGKNAEISAAVEPADLPTEEVEIKNGDSSFRETDESSKLVSDFPRSSRYEYGATENNVVCRDAVKRRRGCNMAGTELFPVMTIENNYSEANCSLENETGVLNIHMEQNKENYHDDPNDRNADSRMLSFVSAVLQPPDELINDRQKVESACPIKSENYDLEGPLKESGEIEKLNERIQLPTGNSHAVLSEEVVHYLKTDVDDKQETTRRRCLVYEMSGSHYRKLLADSTGNSPIQLAASSNTLNDKSVMGNRAAGNRFSSALPSIGLHLNALAAAAAKNKIIVKRQTLTCRRQLINSNTPSSDPIASETKSIATQKAPEIVERLPDKQNEEIQVSGNVPESSLFGEGVEFPPSSPKKKRKKSEDVGEPDSCKRCNCKRSKCLKLYCECFAAGLYCVEPCNCQDCYNKPAHEETVLETRRQIESRNPLAFAPKVIRCSGSPNSVEEEKKTPASARHKRGCNCKKSGCLKKYCECFQGGVGCSLSCRCEGCKNTFGRKEGTESIMHHEPQFLQMNASDAISHDNEKNHDHVTQVPSKNARQLVRQPFHFGFKTSLLPAPASGSFLQSCTTQNNNKTDQTKFEDNITSEVQEDGDAFEALQGDYSLPTTSVKSTSPNCKRISPPHCYFETSPGWRSCRKLILRSKSTFTSEKESTDLPGKR